MKNEPKRFESDKEKHSGSLTSSITLKERAKWEERKRRGGGGSEQLGTPTPKKRQCHSLTQLVTDYSLKVSSTGSSNGGYTTTRPRQHTVPSAWRTMSPARGGGECHQRTKQHWGPQWFQMSKIHQNISSPKVISRVFPCKILHIHITSVSGCLSFTFKKFQTVEGTSMIRQFHNFFKSHFWRDFAIRLNCAPPPPPATQDA